MAIDIVRGIIDFLGSIKDGIIAFLNAIASLAGSLVDMIRSTVEFIWNGIRTLLGFMLEAIKYVWNSLTWLFSSIMDVVLSGVMNVIRIVQCGVTSVYRRFKARIPTLFMYNAMVAYARRVIESGRPLDFLKLPVMGFGAGLAGVAIASILPDIPEGVCVDITPIGVEEFKNVTPSVPRVPVVEYPTFSDRVTVRDKLEYQHIPAQMYSDTVMVTDSFSYEISKLQTFVDAVYVVDTAIMPPPKESVSTDVVHVDSELRTSAERSRASTDTSTVSDTMGYSVVRAQKMRDSVSVSDSFSYEVEKPGEQA